MGLDFTAAKHQKNIDGTQPIFTLDENVHEILMSHARPSKKFPIIQKIADYYSDSVFILGELKPFRAELEAVVGCINMPQVKELLDFVDRAILEQDNIYVYAD